MQGRRASCVIYRRITTERADWAKTAYKETNREGFTMVSLDPVAATYLQARAAASHHSPSDIIGELVRKEMAAATM
jgi:hypothetical protein